MSRPISSFEACDGCLEIKSKPFNAGRQSPSKRRRVIAESVRAAIAFAAEVLRVDVVYPADKTRG